MAKEVRRVIYAELTAQEFKIWKAFKAKHPRVSQAGIVVKLLEIAEQQEQKG